MPLVYLTPDDVTAEQTAAVLDFLNQAQTAEEIAERIEFENELDVGIGVGQRILVHREQLGGAFTTIQQVMDVPYVGPERFTEIVAALNNLSLEGLSSGFATSPDLNSLVAAEVTRQLDQSSIGHGSSRYRVSLGVPDRSFYLGEEIPLRLQIFDRLDNRPVANLAVTIEADNMQMTTAFGLQVSHGSVLDRTTSSDGSLPFRIRFDLGETLSGDQQTVLHDMLRRLDNNAPSPIAIASQFSDLIDFYQEPRNADFRNAVDIMYANRREQLSDSINPQDFLNQWPVRPSLLRVYLAHSQRNQAVVEDITTQQIGIFVINWKEWLLPWYQFFQNRLNSNGLQADFINDKNRMNSENAISAQILSRSYNFVANQSGRIGEALGKQVVDREIRHFLANEIDDYDSATQRNLFPSLVVASNNISATNTGALAVIDQNRVDVERSVDQRINGAISGELGGSLDNINARLDTLDSDISSINTQLPNLDSLNSRLDAIDNNISGISTNLALLNNDVGRIDGQLGTLNTQFNSLDSSFNQLELDLQDIRGDFGTIQTDINQLSQDLSATNTQVGSIRTDLTNTQTQMVTLNNDVQRVGGQVSMIDNRVSTIDNSMELREGLRRDSSGRIIGTPIIR